MCLVWHMETTHLQKRLCQAPSFIIGEFYLDVAYSLVMEDIPYKPKYRVTLYFSNNKIRKKRSFLTKEVKLIPLRNNSLLHIYS